MASLDNLVNRSYSVDTQYFAVGFISGVATAPSIANGFTTSLSSLTAQALNAAGPGGVRNDDGEQLTILSVDDTANTITFDFSIPAIGFTTNVLTDNVLGYDPGSGSILVNSVFGPHEFAVEVNAGTLSSANSTSGILSNASVAGTTITFPVLTASTVVGSGPTPTPAAPTPTPTGTGTAPGQGVTDPLVYRFFDTAHGTQFLTASSTEAASIQATRPDLTPEGVGLYSLPSTAPNAAPVYRFFDTAFGTHFYTSSATEQANIVATRPDLTYEGIGFYEHTTQQAGDVPVYRFFESTNGTHFFTASAAEQAQILATRPDLISEGIGFYAPTA